jgi:anti-anti-sigma factor
MAGPCPLAGAAWDVCSDTPSSKRIGLPPVSSHSYPRDASPFNDAQSSAPFALRLEPMERGWVRVRVEGELALTSSSLLELAVERELEANSDVLLDFSRIAFIDSAGLRAMTALVRIAKANGRRLRLSSELPAHARRLMEIVGLLPFVPIASEEDGFNGPGAARGRGLNFDGPGSPADED